MNSSLIKPDASMMQSEILIHSRWVGASWISGLSGLIPRFTEDLGSADFQTSPSNVLLLISEDDYVANSKSYKTKLAKFIHSINLTEGLKGTAICVKSSDLTDSAFVALQSFCVIDLGLHIIPIRDVYSQLPQLLSQFSASNASKRENPFKFGLRRNSITNVDDSDKKLILTLSSIYGLSDKKARSLLENFGSLEQISEASVSSLTPVVGPSTARTVFNFFNQKRN